MKTIILNGWKEGMDKVGLTKLQTELPGITLKMAKANTDQLLNGEEVFIYIADEHTAVRFCHVLDQLGVEFTVDPGGETTNNGHFFISREV